MGSDRAPPARVGRPAAARAAASSPPPAGRLAGPVVALVALSVIGGCESGVRSAPSTAPPAPARPTARASLAAAPRYELARNRARLRVYRAGLNVSFADEGFRIYDLALRDVWGPLASERRLLGKALLRLPWPGGPAQLVVRHRGKGQLALRGKRYKLPAGQDVSTLSLGDQPAGELELTVEGKGLALGSLELMTPGATPCPASGPDAPAASALGGARALELSLEVPDGAALAFTPRGGQAAVSVRTEDGKRVELWRGRGDGTPRVAPLGVQGQIVTLALESPGCDVWWSDAMLGALEAAAPPRAPAAARNLVLIVVDTLRADRMPTVVGARGAPPQTPRLVAAVARGGAVFARHLAVAPSSPPSHATIHSGQLPRVHGAVGDTAPLAAGAPLLSALLGARGFFTGYAGNNDFAMGRLAKAARWSEAHAPVFEGKGIDCAPLVERGLGLLATARQRGQRAFVTLLPIEPHVPYRFHDGITDRYFAGPYAPPLGKRVTSAHLGRVRARGLPPAGWQQLRALYDGEVTYFDGCYGALEDGLRELGLADDTVVVLTSDHGEGMGERGNNTGHAYSLGHELLWVPLLVFGGPLQSGTVVRHGGATSNLDLAPTVLELLGLSPDPRMQGHSLAPLVRGEPRWPGAAAAEYGKAYAVSAGRWHYVADYEGRGKLYDVIADPAQLHDRSGDAAVPLRYLREAAAVFLSQRTRWRADWGTWTEFGPANPLARGRAP